MISRSQQANATVALKLCLVCQTYDAFLVYRLFYLQPTEQSRLSTN
jgi:hypothetical protein